MAANRSEQPDEGVHHTALHASQKALCHHNMSPTSVSRSSICLSETPWVQRETIRSLEVINVHLEDFMRDLEQYAWKFIEFDNEKIDCIALLIWPLEQAWRTHLKSRQDQGVGGPTKDEENQSVMVSTLRKVCIELGLSPQLSIASMRLYLLLWHAGAWVHEEVFQTAPSCWMCPRLLRHPSLRTTYPVRPVRSKIPLFMCGDHLSFPPVPKSRSILAPLEGTSDEIHLDEFVMLLRKEAKERNDLLTFKIIRLGICIAQAWASTRGGSV